MDSRTPSRTCWTRCPTTGRTSSSTCGSSTRRRYIEAATFLVTCNAQPYSQHDWHWRILCAHRFGNAAAAPVGHALAALPRRGRDRRRARGARGAHRPRPGLQRVGTAGVGARGAAPAATPSSGPRRRARAGPDVRLARPVGARRRRARGDARRRSQAAASGSLAPTRSSSTSPPATLDPSGRRGGAAAPAPPVLACFAHVEPDARERALAAGIDVVVPRSRLNREGPARCWRRYWVPARSKTNSRETAGRRATIPNRFSQPAHCVSSRRRRSPKRRRAAIERAGTPR